MRRTTRWLGISGLAIALGSGSGATADGGAVLGTDPICPDQPSIGCISTNRSSLKIKRRAADPTKSTLTWQWKNGSIEPGTLGDPTTDAATFTLCIYDEDADDPRLAMTAVVDTATSCPGGKPCWKGSGDRFSYVDRTTSQAGIARVKLRGGKPFKSSIQVKGQGEALLVPDAATPTQLFSQDRDVIVQFLHSGGGCWERGYSPAAVRANTPERYIATSP